ncbi:hypothetical protein JYU34_014522 [Plutella xylostella]|uniref:Uncharacterized protein n=1 Tax=Plutella xylostella TaxID=51655 RepID=A0ABQ7Q8J7_PLUXY|nr:hypothetical protein JYU34_014522 [Plutella xylostella]
MASLTILVLFVVILKFANGYLINGLMLNPEVIKYNFEVRVKGNDYIDYSPDQGLEDFIILEVPEENTDNVSSINATQESTNYSDDYKNIKVSIDEPNT